MRVITGKYKGKVLDGFNIEGTRPTMDRVKESLFSMIQNEIKNSVVLDLFAGTGQLGIEALSMGASECYFVDNGPTIINVLKKNLNTIDNAILIKKDYLDALKELELKKIKFDIIILDPPYSKNLIQVAIPKILELDLLNDDGLIICEYETEEFDSTLSLIKERKYGQKYIKIYKKEK